MEKKYLLLVWGLIALCLLSIGVVYYYSDSIAMLNPKGMIALAERNLMGLSIALMLVVVIPVFILTFYIAWHYRAGNTKAEYTPDWNHSVLAETVWWGFPFLIIAILSVVTWTTSHELDPYKPLESTVKPLRIQVVALNWKWLFIYPEQKIATVNYLQFPEKVPLNFELSADAPMNSFWIPELGGQIYAMPGMTSKLHLIADERGTFRGSSANISGKGFAGMVFEATASSSEDFEKWVEKVKQSPLALDEKSYEELAKPSSYQPISFYTLQKEDLFDWIVMKPMNMP